MSKMSQEELIGFIDDEIVAEGGRANACKHDIPKYLCRQNIEMLKQLRKIVEQHFEIPDTSKAEAELEAIIIKMQGELNRLKKEQRDRLTDE